MEAAWPPSDLCVGGPAALAGTTGRVRLTDATRTDTGFVPITDGPRFCELDWIRGGAPGASYGSFTLPIDKVIVSALSTLDDDVPPVDLVRVGVPTLETGAAGTLFSDPFES